VCGNAAFAGTVNDSIVRVARIIGARHEAVLESPVTVRISGVHGFASGNFCPLINIVVISRRERVLVELLIGRLTTVGVGDDASRLTKLLFGDVLLFVELGDVGPEVIVAVIDSLACIEINADIGELDIKVSIAGVVSDGEGFGQIDLGAVRSANGWHLFNAVINKNITLERCRSL